MDHRSKKLTVVINADDNDRYCTAIHALLKRVEVSHGDTAVLGELAPLYELLDLLTGLAECVEDDG